MQLYIVRHGIAVNVGENGALRDRDRMLTPVGQQRTREVAVGLKAMGCAPQCIASPYVRARETAEIIRDVLDSCKQVDQRDELAPSGDPEAILSWLRGLKLQSVMLVGHMPDVSLIASVLTCECGRVEYRFKKASVASISYDGKPWKGVATLEWLLPPKILRRAATAK